MNAESYYLLSQVVIPWWHVLSTKRKMLQIKQTKELQTSLKTYCVTMVEPLWEDGQQIDTKQELER